MASQIRIGCRILAGVSISLNFSLMLVSSDTTLVGDQVTLNVNVFLRSVVQAIGVLIFMFIVSWQLSILAFISVPVITVLSKWYGNFVRSLTKVMQTKVGATRVLVVDMFYDLIVLLSKTAGGWQLSV